MQRIRIDIANKLENELPPDGVRRVNVDCVVTRFILPGFKL